MPRLSDGCVIIRAPLLIVFAKVGRAVTVPKVAAVDLRMNDLLFIIPLFLKIIIVHSAIKINYVILIDLIMKNYIDLTQRNPSE